ncbi:MAG: MBL fold metallo-hydrolase [Deltaproteobacteria bacterium]|nr:MBL fold metallo-hydrolase [Deltaproteobacteria bacterium]
MASKRGSSSRSGELFDGRVYGTPAVPSRRGRPARRGQRATDPSEIAGTAIVDREEISRPAIVSDLDLPFERTAPVPVPTPPEDPRRTFELVGGVHLTGTVLWFDCEHRADLTFLSHAHADFAGKNRRILATDKTLRILTRKSGRIEALTSPYKHPFTLGPLTIEMHPAGHVLGSAQLLVEKDGRRIVYTSDVSTRPSATVERGKPVECDVLVIPATYGSPIYRFPPRSEVVESIRAFVTRCFEEQATPVLLAEQIGISQELIRVLGDAGIKLRVHGSIYEIAKIYREFGVVLPNSRRFQGTPARDEVVIFPPILKKHAAIRKLKKSKTAFVTGRAVEPGFAAKNRIDAAFALDNAPDHAELLEIIDATGANEIYLSGGFVEELGSQLRQKGKKVYSLVQAEQLKLF